MSINTITRRLIGTRELAQKIGYTSDWVIRNWKKLLADKKFPPPVLGGTGPGNAMRWDERAIDLWLDSMIPDNLMPYAGAEASTKDHAAIQDAQIRLQQRAQELSV